MLSWNDFHTGAVPVVNMPISLACGGAGCLCETVKVTCSYWATEEEKLAVGLRILQNCELVVHLLFIALTYMKVHMILKTLQTWGVLIGYPKKCSEVETAFVSCCNVIKYIIYIVFSFILDFIIYLIIWQQ